MGQMGDFVGVTSGGFSLLTNLIINSFLSNC